MISGLWLRDLPPLTATSARRHLSRGRIDLDLPGFRTTGVLSAIIAETESQATVRVSLFESGQEILSSCSTCKTLKDPPCSHAGAILLKLRDHLKSGAMTEEIRKTKSLPVPPGPIHFPPLPSRFPCTTLILAGTRKAPFFVVPGTGRSLMDHGSFNRLRDLLEKNPGTLPEAVEHFIGSFEPWLSTGKDGNPVQGYRPGRDETSRALDFFRRPDITVLSQRHRTPFRRGFLSRAPVPAFTARWTGESGKDLLVEGELVLSEERRPLSNTLWISFDRFSILCSSGLLLFFEENPPLPSGFHRLMERTAANPRIPFPEWAPLLDPGGIRTLDVIFLPPESAPSFGDRSQWRPFISVQGRPDGGLSLRPLFRYSDEIGIPLFGPDRHRLPDYLSPTPSAHHEGDQRLRLVGRDRERELFFRNIFERISGRSSSEERILVQREMSGAILDRVLPLLEGEGFTIDRSELFSGSLLPGPMRIRLSVSAPPDPSSMKNLVQVQGTLETGSGRFPLPLPPEPRGDGSDSSLLQVDSGASVYLEGQSREQYREIHQLFSLDKNGGALVSHFYVAMLLSLRPDLPILPSEDLVPRLKPFLPTPLPETAFDRLSREFTAHLRPYQKDAVSFLVSLWREGLSGILADEMGLGKTISVLGFLMFMRAEGAHPSGTRPPLIVLPASLLYNWVCEAERFCPGIRLHVHAGSGREERLSLSGDADLILTTYGTLRNDSHLSTGPPFACLVLDEAHTIKNPDSQTHRTILSLPVSHRVAITGTPVENRIADLWGLFNLLMPGFLGTKALFEQRFFRSNTEDRLRNERIDLLRNLISPLILRRTKEKVLPDLPPKVEVDIWVDPGPEERSAYARMKERGTEEILSSVLGEGPLRMAYLTLLLRLRQLACHPLILPPDLRGPLESSSKFDLVLEKIMEGTSEGHKILLFSQFTSILDLFEARLPELGIPSVRLDGSTPLKERKNRVDAFQSDDPGTPMVFLASLKAGGIGLTLTRADYVFHYDPWWNPQVEAQASDRSHRLGQRKNVFVYRFLVRGTVEERVQILKESKKEIFDRLMNGSPAEENPVANETETLSLSEMRSLLDVSQSLEK